MTDSPINNTVVAECPFCGNEEDGLEGNLCGKDRYSVYCISCEARGPVCTTPEIALEAWSKRV